MLETQLGWKDLERPVSQYWSWDVLEYLGLLLHMLPLESYFAIQSKIDLLVTVHFLAFTAESCPELLGFVSESCSSEFVRGQKRRCLFQSSIPLAQLLSWSGAWSPMFQHLAYTDDYSFMVSNRQNAAFWLFFMSHTSQARQICEVGSQWNFSCGRTEVGDQMYDKHRMQSWHVEPNTFCTLTVLIFDTKMIRDITSYLFSNDWGEIEFFRTFALRWMVLAVSCHQSASWSRSIFTPYPGTTCSFCMKDPEIMSLPDFKLSQTNALIRMV